MDDLLKFVTPGFLLSLNDSRQALTLMLPLGCESSFAAGVVDAPNIVRIFVSNSKGFTSRVDPLGAHICKPVLTHGSLLLSTQVDYLSLLLHDNRLLCRELVLKLGGLKKLR